MGQTIHLNRTKNWNGYKRSCFDICHEIRITLDRYGFIAHTDQFWEIMTERVLETNS
jgi:hypothetical protein